MFRSRTAAPVLALLVMTASACSDDVIAPADDLEPAFARSASLTDDFDAWDPGVWSAEEHPLGKGWFRAANVSVTGGMLHLTTPAGTYDGGEIASLDRFGGGTFTAVMRCGMPQGTLCAFFLYEGVPGNRNDEIDIEVISGTSTLWVTTWSRGRQTNHLEVTLPFDPAADFHQYTIEYGRKAVAFRVDGNLIATFTSELPHKSMKLLANAWWPTWLNQPPASADASMEIDRIEIR